MDKKGMMINHLKSMWPVIKKSKKCYSNSSLASRPYINKMAHPNIYNKQVDGRQYNDVPKDFQTYFQKFKKLDLG